MERLTEPVSDLPSAKPWLKHMGERSLQFPASRGRRFESICRSQPNGMDSAASKFRVTFRGVRGSIPSPGPKTARYGGYTSCVELRAGDEIIILDAGSGLRQLGADLTSEFGTAPISATLIISHTHWDHIQG